MLMMDTTLLKNKQTLFLIVAALILFIIVIAIAIINLTAPAPQQTVILVTPTPIPSKNTDLHSNPPVVYNAQAQGSLLNKVEERKTLTTNDQAAKTKMLSKISSEGSGTLYQSENVSIDYLSTPNVFQVEILTTNIDQAKKEAVNWFMSQGLSQDAICNYPVQFYLNFTIAEQLRGKNINFSPLAPGCK